MCSLQLTRSRTGLTLPQIFKKCSNSIKTEELAEEQTAARKRALFSD